jgi:hypothetical protein
MNDNIVLTKEEVLDVEFVLLCKSINAKRARTVIDHILKNGVITNEDLSDLYGYDHPPRAIRDVRENGVPLITYKIISPKTGRKIGAYTFDDVSNIKRGRIGGRKAFPKQFKKALIAKYGEKDAITNEVLDKRYLQIDHRIPYEIAGEDAQLEVGNFMLLDASSQRAKSWSCEHCQNFLSNRDIDICDKCFWANPQNYDHIAMEQKRRIDIVWSGSETQNYDKLRKLALENGLNVQDFIKNQLIEK